MVSLFDGLGPGIRRVPKFNTNRFQNNWRLIALCDSPVVDKVTARITMHAAILDGILRSERLAQYFLAFGFSVNHSRIERLYHGFTCNSRRSQTR